MKKQISQDAAREAVAVLDKLVASNDSIKKVVEKAVLCAEKMTNDEHKREKYASRMIIMHYSNLVAAGGGASAIPGLIPFVGPILSIFGVAALDAIPQIRTRNDARFVASRRIQYRRPTRTKNRLLTRLRLARRSIRLRQRAFSQRYHRPRHERILHARTEQNTRKNTCTRHRHDELQTANAIHPTRRHRHRRVGQQSSQRENRARMLARTQTPKKCQPLRRLISIQT